MAPKINLQCAQCGDLACKAGPELVEPPARCPMKDNGDLLDEVRELYRSDAAIAEWAAQSARVEAAGYCHQPRVEEIVAFARRMDMTHLGIASCVGTLREAAMAEQIFAKQGLTVSTVACKVGAIPKEEVGLTDGEKIRPGQFEAICNPIAQARLLERAGAQLNVLVGLCVGHDTLFFQHSRVPTTVLVVKDRVTGHNPAAALYTSRSYYRRLRESPVGDDPEPRE
ncbi:MAG: DUF1847 domain-containing protein [Deltaproteobacteria bacterium]|nr:DUF1847 domain-containing protein [Deltaproteobacteria bacterium]